MGYEDQIKVTFSYIEARFLCGFLVEKYDELMELEKTPAIEEQISIVKRSHNKIMKKLEDE